MSSDSEKPKPSYREMYPDLEYPNVTVQRLEEKIATETSTTVERDDLDSPEKGRRLGNILDKRRQAYIAAFQLTWHGGRTPRGVILLNHEIGWTNRGTVVDTQGNFIGTYERIVDSGGEDAKQQAMLVFIDQ